VVCMCVRVYVCIYIYIGVMHSLESVWVFVYVCMYVIIITRVEPIAFRELAKNACVCACMSDFMSIWRVYGCANSCMWVCEFMYVYGCANSSQFTFF
jgi:hypothetical protein